MLLLGASGGQTPHRALSRWARSFPVVGLGRFQSLGSVVSERRRASGVGRRASGVGRRGVRHQASGIRHQASGIRHQASGVRHRASGVGHRASDIERQTSSVGRRASGVGHQASGIDVKHVSKRVRPSASARFESSHDEHSSSAENPGHSPGLWREQLNGCSAGASLSG